MLHVDLLLLLQTTCPLNQKMILVFVKNINSIITGTCSYFMILYKNVANILR